MAFWCAAKKSLQFKTKAMREVSSARRGQSCETPLSQASGSFADENATCRYLPGSAAAKFPVSPFGDTDVGPY